MIKRVIMFLIRKKLGVKKGQLFRFMNQKSKAWYYIGDEYLVKVCFKEPKKIEKSNVSLNWLLDDECSIKREGYEM